MIELTKSETQIVVGFLLLLLTGVLVKHYREVAHQPQTARVERVSQKLATPLPRGTVSGALYRNEGDSD